MKRIFALLLLTFMILCSTFSFADTYIFMPHRDGIGGDIEISFPGYRALDDGGFEFNWRTLGDSEVAMVEYEHLVKGMYCFQISIDEALNPDDGFTYPQSGYAEYTLSAPVEEGNPDSPIFYATSLGFNVRPSNQILYNLSLKGLETSAVQKIAILSITGETVYSSMYFEPIGEGEMGFADETDYYFLAGNQFRVFLTPHTNIDDPYIAEVDTSSLDMESGMNLTFKNGQGVKVEGVLQKNFEVPDVSLPD